MRVKSSAEPALEVRFHGVRGSIAAPGPRTRRYGGNTPCVEIRAAGARLILDAGTGIRGLGAELAREWASSGVGDRRVDLFLTHYHWDHIQGLPFFEPLFDAGVTLRLYGPEAASLDGGVVEAALWAQLAPPHFPIGRDDVAATIVGGRGESPWREGELEVDALPVAHPGRTLAYRVRAGAGGPAIAYVPDCELTAGTGTAPGPGWYDDLVRFLDGVDLLIHDAMYDDDEHAARSGWGHSTPAQAVRLADAAGVRQLRLFHHAPWRDDDALEALVAATAKALPGAGAEVGVEVAAAAEGATVCLPALELER